MDIKEIENYKREIAVILLLDPNYKDVQDIDEELLVQIVLSIKGYETKIDECIAELRKPPKGASMGPWISK